MTPSKWAMNGAVILAALIFLQSIAPMAAHARDNNPGANRKNVDAPPVKDCTRYNGRHGYYANQWCTADEQARWDKWEAARLKGR